MLILLLYAWIRVKANLVPRFFLHQKIAGIVMTMNT
jgi:hypothetical protein